MHLQWLGLALLCCAALVHCIQVETVYGTVEGRTIELLDDWHAGISINSFYSIPFARPPLGDLRFAPPEEPDAWDDVFQADFLGTVCEQNPISVVALTHPGWDDYGEDCLHLNIFAPADQSGAPYPVMVWMFGGGYQSGASMQYGGHFLAAQGVVVVIPNYRLNIMGFAYSGDDAIPGNAGLMDQTLALQFVQENILAFGGDPDMVTIAGESAGAGSVGLQMMTPYAAGLFHYGILQSGQELSTRSSEENLLQVAVNVNCTIDNTEEMAECLRQVSPEELRRAVTRCGDLGSCSQRPKVDGDYIPDTPGNLRESGEFNIVPEMIGYNKHDGYLSLLSLGPDQWENGVNRSDFQQIIREYVEDHDDVEEEREEDAYQAIDFYYSPWPHIEDGHLNMHQLGEISTDKNFFRADWQAKMHYDYAPVYYYVFDFMPNSSIPEFMGTPHIMELPYTWGHPFSYLNPHVQNETGIVDIFTWREVDMEYSYFMMQMWTNFVKYGSPTPDPMTPPVGEGPVDWVQFTEDNLNYIYFGKEQVEVNENFRQHEYAFWREYLQWMVYGDDGISGPDVLPALLNLFDIEY